MVADISIISLLIRHIPEPHYKMTRYYGLYAGHRDNDKKLRKAIRRSKHKFILRYSKWRNNITVSFGYDPLWCSRYSATMTLTDLYFKHKRVSLEEMYERPMAKIKCRSNPPEGMTAKPVKNMSDSDLLDMHYVLTEDDDRDGDKTQEGFYNRPLSVIALFLCPLLYGLFLSEFLRQKQLRVLARMVV